MYENIGDSDLIVVAAPNDQLAAELSQAALCSGRAVQVLDQPEAARLFSITIGDGQVMVEPDVPLFLRLPSQPPIRESFGAAFHLGESTGTLWAAGALMKSACINRPGHYGFAGRFSFASSMFLARAGINNSAMEIFSRNFPLLAIEEQPAWGVQDTVTLATAIWPNVPLPGSGPYRARSIHRDPAYEIAVVVGRESWRLSTTPLDHLKLEEKSEAIIEGLGVIFGAIIWSVSLAEGDACVARIEPYPPFSYVQPIWEVVSTALLNVLVK